MNTEQISEKYQAMFTSYRIGFCSVSQNYTVWCEHTFPSIFMLSMSLKTLNIILMCFDGKNCQNNKRMSKVLKIDLVLHSLGNSNFGCCSRSALLI